MPRSFLRPLPQQQEAASCSTSCSSACSCSKALHIAFLFSASAYSLFSFILFLSCFISLPCPVCVYVPPWGILQLSSYTHIGYIARKIFRIPKYNERLPDPPRMPDTYCSRFRSPHKKPDQLLPVRFLQISSVVQYFSHAGRLSVSAYLQPQYHKSRRAFCSKQEQARVHSYDSAI